MQLCLLWNLLLTVLTAHLPSLDRFPPAPDSPLQAWDSADQYLLQSLLANALQPDRPILIFDDRFGALACALATLPVTSISDSYVSHQALAHNLAKLGLPAVQTATPLDDWPARPQLVLIRLPKQLSLLRHYLARLKPLLAADTMILAAGRDRDIPERAESLLGQYLGHCERLLGWKKARAFLCHSNGQPAPALPAPLCWPLAGSPFTLSHQANVFSRQSLDIGARLMLANLPSGRFQRIIDLGCGNGVLALMMASRYPDSQYTLVDESYLAVASASQNMASNLPQVHAEVQANNCLDGFASASADLVLCNPPFHQQQAVTDHIAWQMFKDSLRVLRPGGQLWIVGNRHLGYHLKLKRLFGGCQVVASDRKFVVLKAIKRTSR